MNVFFIHFIREIKRDYSKLLYYFYYNYYIYPPPKILI